MSEPTTDVRVFAGFADLRAAVGQELGVSAWTTIAQERVDAFAHATGDHQWIHTDPARARVESPYGTTVAHGFLTLSLSAAFAFEIYRVAGVKLALNYGVNKVRFVSPVAVGSRVRMRAHLLEVETTATGFRTIVRGTFEVDGQEKPACVAELITAYVL